MAYDDTQTSEEVTNQNIDQADAGTQDEAQAVAPVAAAQTVAEPLTDEIAPALGQKETFDYKDANGNVLRSYTFQFPGVTKGAEIAELYGKSYVEYADQLFKQLAVDPQLRNQGIEFFDTHKGLYEVIGAASKFLNEVLDGVRR